MDKVTEVSLTLRATETCTAAADVVDLSVPGSLQPVRRVLAVVIHVYPDEETSSQEGKAAVKEEGW